MSAYAEPLVHVIEPWVTSRQIDGGDGMNGKRKGERQQGETYGKGMW
jgi:hypothetical protein